MIKIRNKPIEQFRKQIERSYRACRFSEYASFDEILCYEIHTQPVNPRMATETCNDGCQTGLTFRGLASKWGISTDFLGKLIADHCSKLEGGE